jgi:HlyD family secretion protein
VGLASGGTARASGKIVPLRQAELSFAVAGQAQTVVVEIGSQVEAGALLLALDPATAEASVAQARAALRRAQAQLEELQAGPRPQEIAAAQAGIAAAQAHLAQLTEEPRPEEVAAAEAELAAAQARHESLYAEPDGAVVAAAWANVQQAQATLQRLLHPATASQIAEAQAQVESAQAGLDLLGAGARKETLDAALAAVTEAAAALRRSETDLAGVQLTAPFTGTVTALGVSPGEVVQAGEVVLTLADLSYMQVETTDLSERDVVRVVAGQPAVVLVEALSAQIPGRVVHVAPQATVIGGDVVYTVMVELDEQPPDLRWGMSVDVEIAVE